MRFNGLPKAEDVRSIESTPGKELIVKTKTGERKWYLWLTSEGLVARDSPIAEECREAVLSEIVYKKDSRFKGYWNIVSARRIQVRIAEV